MKRAVLVVAVSSLALFPVMSTYAFLNQLNLLESESPPKQANYTIINDQTSTVIRVTNQKKESRRKKIEQKKKLFQQLEMQLAVLESQKNLERGSTLNGVFGSNLKAMSGTLLCGYSRQQFNDRIDYA